MMKKLLFCGAVIFIATCAVAQFVSDGGFKDLSGNIQTVASLKDLPDDAYVVLNGHIEKRLSKEDYLFVDGTGSIRVEIDDDEWRGVTVTPNDVVEIAGELDKGIFADEIDVHSVKKVVP